MAKKKGNGATAEQAVERADAANTGSASNMPGMPLFFKRPVAVDKVRHAKAGLAGNTTAAFARETNSIAINTLEFIEASKFYPIVFTPGDNAIPIAIVGLEKQNFFVGKDGKWRDDTYVPAYVRQYPFVLFEDDRDKKFILCVDEGSPHFRAEAGPGVIPFFNPDGTPSPMSNQAVEFCSGYFQHHTITRNFVADMKKHKLLAPYHSSLTTPSGRQLSLSGFEMVDETAVNSLPDEAFAELRKKGWLPFIYLALSSGSNWRRLSALATA